MPGDRLMRIHSPEFQAMAERVLQVTALTSRLNVLPFEDDAGKAALFEQILGRPLPAKVGDILSSVEAQKKSIFGS